MMRIAPAALLAAAVLVLGVATPATADEPEDLDVPTQVSYLMQSGREVLLGLGMDSERMAQCTDWKLGIAEQPDLGQSVDVAIDEDEYGNTLITLTSGVLVLVVYVEEGCITLESLAPEPQQQSGQLPWP